MNKSEAESEIRKYKIDRVFGIKKNNYKILEILFNKFENVEYIHENNIFLVKSLDCLLEESKNIHNYDNEIKKLVMKYALFIVINNVVYLNGNMFDLEIPNLELFKEQALCIINDIYKLDISKIVIDYYD